MSVLPVYLEVYAISQIFCLYISVFTANALGSILQSMFKNSAVNLVRCEQLEIFVFTIYEIPIFVKIHYKFCQHYAGIKSNIV